MTAAQSVQIGGAVLALGVLLATVVSRLVPGGAWRRTAEDMGIILGCAAPALALIARFLQHRSWPGAAVIAVAYGGFYLIRMRQLRRANRDSVRRLLGLHKDATYGEALQQVERMEPRDVTAAGQVVLIVAALAMLAVGVLLDQFTAAVAGVSLGVAEGTVRAAYRRSLARKVRSIGH
ncbi:MAG TPA: hypothetical protein VGC71_03225 [Gaiellales bacterium]